MKVLIENKETTLKLNEEKFVKYSDLLVSVINKPIKESLSINDMRRDLRVLDSIEKGLEMIELEDTDIAYVKDEVKKSSWAIRHPDILAFADYIDGLQG